MERKTKHTVGIYTLGCKVNQYESEAIAEALRAKGFSVSSKMTDADGYIINTCTVTAESDRKARQLIRRAIQKNKNAFVIVTGCYAQTSPEKLAAIDGVDCVIGNASKLACVQKLCELFENGEKNRSCKIITGDLSSLPFEKMSITSFERTRAYIKIEDGCENRCTYCIIPNARGSVRSKAPDELLDEIKSLALGGCREVVLTGIETASYGKDLDGVDLGDILCRADKLEGISRIRLGSLDPSLIKPQFAEKISSLTSLAPHFHLSLQSGSNRILAKMKRKYNTQMAMEAIELLRKVLPSVQFTTDVIVGFPGETEEDFRMSCEFVEKAEFLGVHVFPYSKRAGTLAAEMPDQLSEEIKAQRVHILSQIAARGKEKILKRECKSKNVHSVLFETFDGEFAYGHSPSFLEIAVSSDRDLRSEIFDVMLENTDGKLCFGKIV